MIPIILLLALCLLFAPASNAISISLGEAAPEFSLPSAGGKIVNLSSYKDKVIVLVYWRTGQQRSVLALQDGNEVLKEFDAKDVVMFNIIAGSDDKDQAEAMLAERNINSPLLIDADRKFYSDYGIRVYPSTVVINREGVLTHDIPSHPLTYKTVLEGYVKNALGEIDDAELMEVLSPHRETRDKRTLEAHRQYNLAMKFTEARLFDQAIDSVNKSIATKGDLADSHILAGFLYLEAEEGEKAKKAFERSLEIEPSSKDAETGLGGALILTGQYDEAIRILEAAAVANPYPQMAYYELGRAYEMKGDKEKAIEMYKRAIEKLVHKKVLPASLAKCE